MELLTMVSFVCRHQPRIQALDHVMWIIDAFADFSDKLALPEALETTNPRFFARAVHYIAESPRFDEQEKCSLLRPATGRAAVRGDMPAVELCKAIIPFRCEVALIAALRGDLPLLKWIWDTQPTVFHHGDVWVEQVAFDVAAERGDLVTVQWLVAAFPDKTWSLGSAAIGGRLDMIIWLHHNANVSESLILNAFTRSVYAALAVGNWRDCIEKYCFNRQEPPLRWRYGIPIYFSVKAMDWAAQSGNLELLQWFNDNGREGCSAVAVMIAAEAGNMEALLWLHENHSNLWTSRAMDLAAEQG
ncbi:hypothetical protein PF005_g23612 [Phytophthora fragariae]|uniref:Ankyrin repeat protein n=1 Tax=Phytophthora fragariae TaxID=53985 RepID=A0A6A3DYZ0_9STRA|nr:hypothetical protein PF009_g24365 [Phytophthora fragariae]KAE9078964.1 hypothetical protein PF007_g23640 [Phytophthora fragariae]KAE9100446.1 hypothetical protein PF006_g22899 [Phytophthora fragariae]KAE9179657.1 hypothetical protein PF005_g23612 [Phytophthora fragariae]KAE9190939.1 hypothetical protein PF002_g24638 [Phytophthora fragariae]